MMKCVWHFCLSLINKPYRRVVIFALMTVTLMNRVESSDVVVAKNIYANPTEWTTSTGTKLKLSTLEGKKTVLALFYTECRAICPMTVESLKGMEKALGEKAKDVNFVLVSIDPRIDTPKKLDAYVKKHKIENWKIIKSDEAATRKLAGDLNIGFSDKPGGDVHQMHSRAFAFINEKGRLLGSLPSFDTDLKKAQDFLR